MAISELALLSREVGVRSADSAAGLHDCSWWKKGAERVNLLLFSSLYPNAVQQRHGIFVEQRLLKLLELRTGIAARVIAPVPWFPWSRSSFGRYAEFAQVPRHEIRHGIEVTHPRFPVVPKVGFHVAPLLMAYAMRPVIANVLKKGWDFDPTDAHFVYPDGVAAVWLGRWFSKPVVITARGNDITLMPTWLLPRKQILWAARHARAMVAVCQALKDAMVGIGIPGQKIKVLRNGVDPDTFRPVDRALARARLGLDEGELLLSVGHLIKRKGNHVTIEALADLPGTHLLLVGDGEEEESLRWQAHAQGVADRVHFLGSVQL